MERLSMARPRACASFSDVPRAPASEPPCPVCCSAGGNHPRREAFPPFPPSVPFMCVPCMRGWWQRFWCGLSASPLPGLLAAVGCCKDAAAEKMPCGGNHLALVKRHPSPGRSLHRPPFQMCSHGNRTPLSAWDSEKGRGRAGCMCGDRAAHELVKNRGLSCVLTPVMLLWMGRYLPGQLILVPQTCTVHTTFPEAHPLEELLHTCSLSLPSCGALKGPYATAIAQTHPLCASSGRDQTICDSRLQVCGHLCNTPSADAPPNRRGWAAASARLASMAACRSQSGSGPCACCRTQIQVTSLYTSMCITIQGVRLKAQPSKTCATPASSE